jgi:hypothetical protein
VKNLGNPKEGTEPRSGVIKLYKVSSTRALNKEINKIPEPKFEIIKTRGFFIKERRVFLFQLPLFSDNIILYFPPNEEDFDFENNPILKTANFQFPRLKVHDENSFILSGLVLKEESMWLAIGKFIGKIPDIYWQSKDEMVYPDDYWR